jgi:hypothetical protein
MLNQTDNEENNSPASGRDEGWKELRSDCPCPKQKCERHGWCDDCRDWHGRKNKLPRCEK